jgi:dTDP-4-amino-4,6-dideoxygalactose transaminase
MSLIENTALNLRTELDIVTDAFQDVLRHRQYILGPEVESLERKLASWLETRYAVGCNSGFGAYLLSLLALGIGRGKKIVIPAFTPAAYLGIITRRGATPVLVDVAANDFHISPTALANVLDRTFDAIVVHHFFGGVADMNTIVTLANSTPIIEVLTYSLGTRIGKDYSGTFGTLAISCLREETTLGAYGDAGIIWTNHSDLNERLRRIREESSLGSMHEDYISGNFHQDTIHAAILLRKFEGWVKSLEVRRQKSMSLAEAITKQNLSEIIVPDFYKYDATHFVILAEKRNELVAYLQSKDIPATAWWPIPIYQQPGFRSLGYRQGDFPEAERVAERSVYLPFPPASESDIDKLINELVRFYRM